MTPNHIRILLAELDGWKPFKSHGGKIRTPQKCWELFKNGARVAVATTWKQLPPYESSHDAQHDLIIDTCADYDACMRFQANLIRVMGVQDFAPENQYLWSAGAQDKAKALLHTYYLLEDEK